MFPEPLKNAKEISTNWLEAMLTEHTKNEVKVHNFKVNIPSRTQGFLSEICYVTVKYFVSDNVEESKLVFKFMPEEKELVSFMEMGQLAEREVAFYKFSKSKEFQTVCKDSSVQHLVPKIFYCSLMATNLTIVMEDLRAHNYDIFMRRDGSNLQETVAALRSVALVHAAAIVYKHNHGCFDVESRKDNDFYDEFLIPNLKILADWCENKSQSKLFLELVSYTKEMRTLPDRHPLVETIIHGDLWAAQTLLLPDCSSACLLDWQFCMVGNPVIDILAMFFMSSDSEVLELHLEEVLSAYWTTFNDALLKQELECPFTLQQLMDNIEELWIFGFVFLAVSIHDFLEGNSISKKRLLGYLEFLNKKKAFSKFIDECKAVD